MTGQVLGLLKIKSLENNMKLKTITITLTDEEIKGLKLHEIKT